MKIRWSKDEEAYLRISYGKIATEEIAIRINRPLGATKRKIDNMGIRGGLRKQWTQAELDIVNNNTDKSTKEVCALLSGRPRASVRKKLEDAKKARKALPENPNA